MSVAQLKEAVEGFRLGGGGDGEACALTCSVEPVFQTEVVPAVRLRDGCIQVDMDLADGFDIGSLFRLVWTRS